MNTNPQSSGDQWRILFSVPADPGFGVHEVVVDDLDAVPKVGMSVKLDLKEKGVTVEFAVISCELLLLEQEASIELRKWDQGFQSN